MATVPIGSPASLPRQDFYSNFDAGLAAAQSTIVGQFMAPLATTGNTTKGRIKVPDRTNINATPDEGDHVPSMGEVPRRTYLTTDVQWAVERYGFETPYDPTDMSRLPNPQGALAYLQQANALALADAHETRVLSIFDAAITNTSSSTNGAVSTFRGDIVSAIESIIGDTRLRPNRMVMSYVVAHKLMQDSTLAGLISPQTLDQSLTVNALINYFRSGYGLETRIGYSPQWTSVATVYVFIGEDNPQVGSYGGSALTLHADSMLDLYDYEYSKNLRAVGAMWELDEVVLQPYSIFGIKTVT